MRLDPITLIARSGCYARVERNQIPQPHQAAKLKRLYELVLLLAIAAGQKVKPDDHSEVVPLLPIPNRTVKRLRADDSAHSRVKVGHRQASTSEKRPVYGLGVFFSSSCLESAAAPIDVSGASGRLQSLEQTSESAETMFLTWFKKCQIISLLC